MHFPYGERRAYLHKSAWHESVADVHVLALDCSSAFGFQQRSTKAAASEADAITALAFAPSAVVAASKAAPAAAPAAVAAAKGTTRQAPLCCWVIVGCTAGA